MDSSPTWRSNQAAGPAFAPARPQPTPNGDHHGIFHPHPRLCGAFIVLTLGVGILIAWLPLGIVGRWFVYRIARGWLALERPAHVHVSGGVPSLTSSLDG